jgi:hypothetical protein
VIERKKKKEKDQNGSVTGLFKRNSGTEKQALHFSSSFSAVVMLNDCHIYQDPRDL